MKFSKCNVIVSVFVMLFFLSGCDLSDEEKEKLNDAQVDLEKLADQIIVTHPATDSTVTESVVTVRADIPPDAEAQEVSLFVDGVEVAKDSDGAPWEISWPAYYWADGQQHTILLKTVTGGGNEVRNNQRVQVTVSEQAKQALSFVKNTDGMQLKDADSVMLEYNTFPGATKYQVSYTHNGQTVEADSAEASVELSGLQVGEYVLRYRAVREQSGLTTLVGPWSDSATLAVLPPDLPIINKPVISSLGAVYSVDVSWDSLGEGDAYTAYFTDTSKPSDVSTYELGNDTSLAVADLAVGTYEFQLKRTNSLGHSSQLSQPLKIKAGLFHKKFGGTGDDRAKHVLATRSGQYLVLGTTNSFGDHQGDDWILKLDGQGEMVWEYLHRRPAWPVLEQLVELSDGKIIGFGTSGSWGSRKGLLLLMDAEGGLIWEKEYTNARFDQTEVKGAAEREGAVYILAQGGMCTTTGSSTSCTRQAPVLEAINIANGEVTSSVQLPNLVEGEWDSMGSFSATTSGNFLLGYSIKNLSCSTGGGDCQGAGMTIVNTHGEVQSDWNSIGTAFLNGMYAAESPLGGYVLSGQGKIGNLPVALFDASAVNTGTYVYLHGYSNHKTYIAFNNMGRMFQLVGKVSADWPVLISRDNNGIHNEIKTFTELKREKSYSAALDSTVDNGLIFVFTEGASGENPDIVVIKTGNFE